MSDITFEGVQSRRLGSDITYNLTGTESTEDAPIETVGAYEVYSGGTDLDDGIEQPPAFKTIDHNYISDWEAAVKGVTADLLPEYVDDAAAVAGGLEVGRFYWSGAMVKQVRS